jgi:hypothetical protein
LCEAGDWPAVQQFWEKFRGDAGTASRDTEQIRIFHETGSEAVFITFHGGLMYWCIPTGPVNVLEDGSHFRSTVDGWHSTTLGGVPLQTERLSGHLLKVQMFRGTICRVKAREYLIHKLNDELHPQVLKADEAEEALRLAVISLMRMLTWQDFELLVELVFSASGWRRLGAVGKTQKTVDIELWLPTLESRAFVQVKAQTTSLEIKEYIEKFTTGSYDHMFFVWHSGDVNEQIETDGVTLLGPNEFARLVMETGLVFWLKDKVS